MLAQDVGLVAAAIQRAYGHVEINADYGWGLPSLNVLDCVLSLNRRYNSFVLPRIRNFGREHPNVNSLEELEGLIEEHESPCDFMCTQLNYNHTDRARILGEVIDYLLYEESQYAGRSQRQRLKKWALSMRPGDAFFTGIKGFGLSGFQYLRMLFGAQTAKPDVHIKRFVSNIVEREINDVTSLVVLERAARSANLPLREVDAAIWEERA